MDQLGTAVGLGSGHSVLQGDQAPPPPKKEGEQQPPIFGPRLLWPNGWMDQDATWYKVRPRPRPHCYMGTHLQRGTAPNFRPMSVVAKRL